MFERSIYLNDQKTKDERDCCFSIINNEIDRVKDCIKNEVIDVNIEPGDFPNQPLFYTKTKEMAALLINAGADITAKDDYGNSLLVNANAEVTEYLLSFKQIDINASSYHSGFTPLKSAVLFNDTDKIKVLFAAKAIISDPYELLTPYSFHQEISNETKCLILQFYFEQHISEEGSSEALGKIQNELSNLDC